MERANDGDEKTMVYVVDDDADVRRGVERLLRAAGRRCRVFSDAADYLGAELEPCDADCLLLDIRMPGITGTELQAKLHGTDRDAPIVFVTGHGDIPTCVQAMKEGAIGFLAKPFDEAHLLAAVDEALGVSRERRADHARRESARLRFARLSCRERDVCDGVVRGLLNKQIAAALGIAEKTVKVHRGRVMVKMNVESVAELVRVTALLDTPTPPAPPAEESA